MSRLGWLLVLASALFTVAANLLMRMGVERAGGFGGDGVSLPAAVLGLLRQPRFVLGMFCYGLAALVWFRVIASEPLSTAYPLLVAMTFVMVTAGAVVLFQEAVPPIKAFGIAVILLGIFMISRAPVA